MKLFILLIFCLNFLSSETQNLTNEHCESCRVVLPEKSVENELKTILFKVKAYKKEKNLQIEALRKKLLLLNNRFNSYKVKKIHESQQREKTYIKKLNAKNSKIKALQHELSLVKQEVAKKNIQNETPKRWINITVNNDLNIYDLALKYYGDSQEYEKIYMANQNKIDENYQIKNGMSLKIPITENFMEQPMFINTAN